MKKRKRLPVKARMSTYCAAPRSSTLLSERGHMTCSCGWTMLLSKMKQPGESKFITNHFIHCLTVWGVEPVVTHQTSWLESTGVPTKPTSSSAMKQPGESKFFVTNNILSSAVCGTALHPVCHATCAKRDLHLVVALNMDTLAVTRSSCYRNGCWICHVTLYHVYMRQAVTQQALPYHMIGMK